MQRPNSFLMLFAGLLAVALLVSLTYRHPPVSDTPSLSSPCTLEHTSPRARYRANLPAAPWSPQGVLDRVRRPSAGGYAAYVAGVPEFD